MKRVLAILFFTFITNGCVAKMATQHNYKGFELDKKFKKLQESNLTYEADDENGGGIYSDEVSIYKTSNNQCVLVSKINGDSGVYGTERILFFYNSKFKDGYMWSYSYTPSNKKINYIELIKNKETQNALHIDFKNYIKKMNKDTLNKCS